MPNDSRGSKRFPIIEILYKKLGPCEERFGFDFSTNNDVLTVYSTPSAVTVCVAFKCVFALLEFQLRRFFYKLPIRGTMTCLIFAVMIPQNN